MKKLTYLILFISVISTAQPISPYYPEPLNHGRYLTPMTYVDFNHVTMKLQDFLSDRYRMVLVDSKFNVKNEKGNIIYDFQSGMIANSSDKLTFNFKVFAIGHSLVIQEITVTGSLATRIRFFVRYWPTTITIEDLEVKKVATSNYYMDVVEFFPDKITVKNNTIKSTEEFLALYAEKSEK